ncbi:geranylgeranyl reductase family protein [Streptomyces somaliensis]|uniref:Geranylgeranyl reductase family protein n=1 Tax=Streptomyces somaliensis (strain ATCC 33201 / DSM 40738 / JCM 12659 / KCTC 9044 / NCTC 11332 / NRRL B-12077 / IP 733) TaxID=1134445 RepID=A0AA44DH42_STRE0|nr:geranylgeranyl reductase family protein [Streptomyces somaliensis]MCP9945051.1 geranylgeranyl reductase family protein [Streptomyces somaliensis]MCP9961734.1 geranylgeranyl reductase family protein [Streptomyces somaliensis]MCP9974549.1 geranylgeranyl reductase family protein [Streptomyces somaliensis]MCQ0024278.1 geranylgeranyl reductase family protein [Streptomyces somaliensis DSM 40738]NKY16167.1 geranylgeranyl reductase family protein [Streptomyces somaliensis DSM 40738]
MTETLSEHTADVIVVGAGPAGSTTAYHLAKAGLDVLLLEKTAFPREKVCGDGLTPRATKQLVAMGIDVSEEAGWSRNRGLRIIGGGVRLQLDWPELATYPDYGLVRRRDDFDELLARQAQKAGARLYERCNVGEPVTDPRTGRITGVHARLGEEKTPVTFRAPLVVAADGNSSRLSLAMGLHRREDRPMGVAVRTYFTTPRHEDDYLESWLELWDRRGPGPDRLLPGYGWIFGMGDGTSNVGLGILNSSSAFRELDWREVLKAWCASVPEDWGFTPDNMTGPIRGAALPMAFNRQPHYTRGLLLVGDAGGLVNPFNGEGIAYAMESGRLAADVIVQAHARSTDALRERALHGYPRALKDAYGGYYTLGRAFVKLIGNPKVMQIATQRGLTHPVLMRFTLKMLANLTDPTGGDAMDRIINGLSKVAPRS